MRMAAVFSVADDDSTPPFILDLDICPTPIDIATEEETPTRFLVESAVRKYLYEMNGRLIAKENDDVRKGLKVRHSASTPDDIIGDWEPGEENLEELGICNLKFEWDCRPECGDLHVSIYAERLADYLDLGFAREDRKGLEL